MSGAKSQGGRLTAKADYTNTITEHLNGNDWDTDNQWTVSYDLDVYGSGSDGVSLGTTNLTVSYGTGGDTIYRCRVYNGSNTELLVTDWYDTGQSIDLSAWLNDTQFGNSNDVIYTVRYQVQLSSGSSISASNMVYTDLTLLLTYSQNIVTQEPFTLPADWTQNTTNTIADEFVPFETVTTPIDSDGVGDSVDEFKDFLEGVQEHETLATVFMGYVSELFRLKGITAFICFAICCMTMIAIFELSGG